MDGVRLPGRRREIEVESIEREVLEEVRFEKGKKKMKEIACKRRERGICEMEDRSLCLVPKLSPSQAVKLTGTSARQVQRGSRDDQIGINSS